MAFIKENHIFLNQQLQTQEDVFHFLAKKSTELEVAQNWKLLRTHRKFSIN